MTHVVTDNCVNCKFTDCITVCPVDAFYELEKQLVIDSEECIDCGACAAECPVEAIYADDELPEGLESALEFNEEAVTRLKNEGAEPLTDQLDPLPTAEAKKQDLGY
ncbi:MAG: ferredoxin [Acidobacteria bacterium]|nr:MAG: ferredoxin [Acidobacteriota bacterium]